MSIDKEQLSVVLATDCGSTTTKAVLFEKTAEGWRQTARGEAPTTVEKPVADVTIGARNAFREVQELSGRMLLDESHDDGRCPLIARTAEAPERGVDLYVSTSSAGGGLQMIVAGVVSSMTTASAERAALGAGAIVMDSLSVDDGREQHERVQKIRHLRPDIILIAGGTDGGTASHPLELSETVLQADPRPRFGDTLRLPVIYAANQEVAEQAREILDENFAFVTVPNIRPSLEEENLAPARDEIHELFLNHVMSHAPGYKTLLSWSPLPILPTPAAVGDMVLAASKPERLTIIAVDIGGATTDVFSVFENPSTPEDPLVFNRTVSANLGMSYSVANVLLEAGEEAIQRWLPYHIELHDLRDRLRNKMIRPTSIPQTLDDLLLEQAVCREALRLAFVHHKRLAVGLKGTVSSKNIGNVFRQKSDHSLVNMMKLDLIIGSGGVLSHAPERKSSAFMLLDAYEPEGVTRLAVDSIFMMPHLGVFSSIHPEGAAEVFFRDCLVELGTAIAPTGRVRHHQALLKVTFKEGPLNGQNPLTLHGGEIQVTELAAGEAQALTLQPLQRGVDVGAGAGQERQVTVLGGHAGIIFDGRGRPITFPEDALERRRLVSSWYRAFSFSGIEELLTT